MQKTQYTNNSMHLKQLLMWYKLARPKTLLIGLGPIFIGLAYASQAGFYQPILALLTFTSAIFIQLGTNFNNDYADGIKGSDATRQNRGVGSGKIKPNQMKLAYQLCFTLAICSACFLVYKGGLSILAIGLSGIFFGWLYTSSQYALAYKGLAEPIVFLYFGPIAVAGTAFLQTQNWDIFPFILGIGPGCLAIALLTINNCRDIVDDKKNQKNTWVVKRGIGFGHQLIIIMWLIALATPVAIMLVSKQHSALILSQLIGFLALPVIKQLKTQTPNYDALLAKTARLALLYCLILGLCW